MERQLIINADDFGMSREVNEGICRGIEAGLVNNVSLMVNLPYFGEAVEFLRHHPEISVGLHFNVTEGKPILPPREVESLLKEDNSFYHWMSLVVRLLLRDAKISQIKQEFLAQYQRLRQTGLTITHIDSHHHLHLYPPLFEFVTRLADTEGIRALRCHRFNLWSLTLGAGKRPTLRQLVVALLLWFDSLFYNHRHLDEVDGLYDLNWDKRLTEKALLAILERLPAGRTELICHLGVLSESGNRKFLEPRARVLEFLCRPSVREHLHHNGVKLVQRENDAPALLTRKSPLRALARGFLKASQGCSSIFFRHHGQGRV